MADSWNPDPKRSGEKNSDIRVEYFKVKAGETAQVRFLTEPIRRWVHNIPIGTKRYPATCIGSPQTCPAHLAGHKAKKVMASWVLDRRDGKPKLYEFSNRSLEKIDAVRKTVVALKPELENPLLYDLAISRVGTTMEDTVYSFSLGTNIAYLTEAEKQVVSSLSPLEDYYKENKERMESLLKGEVPKRKEEETVGATNTENPLAGDGEV